ncbi:hypothetical protein PHISCL_10987, partial [Aspergillus sclerotialis]
MTALIVTRCLMGDVPAPGRRAVGQGHGIRLGLHHSVWAQSRDRADSRPDLSLRFEVEEAVD